MLGGKRAARKRRRAPLRLRPRGCFWAFVVALVLFSLGGVFALYEGFSRSCATPMSREPSAWRSASWCSPSAWRRTRCAPTGGQGAQGSRPVVVAVHPHGQVTRAPRRPARGRRGGDRPVHGPGPVLLAHFTDEPRWGAVGSIAIGALLVVIAITLAVEMKGLLVGESASPEDVGAIAAALSRPTTRTQRHPHEDPAHRPRRVDRRSQGRVRPDDLDGGLADSINAAEESARRRADRQLVYIEPDIRRAPRRVPARRCER